MTAKQSKGYTVLMNSLAEQGIINALMPPSKTLVGNGWDVIIFPSYNVAADYLFNNSEFDCIRSMTMFPGGVSTGYYYMDTAFISLPNGNTKAVQVKLFKFPQKHPLYGDIVGWALV